jgi:biopolymer transport protein ExbD
MFGTKTRRSNKLIVPKLQITAMMDMFTIIMIFLLVSFSSNPEKMRLDKDIQLPESTAEQDYVKNIKLVVSESSIEIEGETVAEVRSGEISDFDGELTKTTLFHRLRSFREIADQQNGDEKKAEHLLFFCDKRLPFKTINKIIKTAGMAGYPNLQFAVLEK